MRSSILATVAVALITTTAAYADLTAVFSGFDATWGIGTSGHKSSYHDDTVAGNPVAGGLTGSALPVFSPDLVSYPAGIGEVPSPGGAIGLEYDQGAIGIAATPGGLSIRLASALDPRLGVFNDRRQVWYGQGDVFVAVNDSDGVRHYALLNEWAKDGDDLPIDINHGYFNAARDFHLAGGNGGESLIGDLVELKFNGDVALSGGSEAYGPGNAPDGLDLRMFAEDGDFVADGDLTITEVIDSNRTWYVQTWTVPLDAFSGDASYKLALHAGVSCGNDQAGGIFFIPEPTSFVLLAIGLLVTARRARSLA